jgi:hypothetical protein
MYYQTVCGMTKGLVGDMTYGSVWNDEDLIPIKSVWNDENQKPFEEA